MATNNSISGVILNQDTENGLYICYVEEFSDELKKKIREMFSSIWHMLLILWKDHNLLTSIL